MEFLIFFYFDMYLTNYYVGIGAAVISSVFAFMGAMRIFKDVTEIIPSSTRKPRRLKILTGVMTILAVVFVVYQFTIYSIIGYNDLGIILQILGFLIYIPHVTTFLLRMTSKSEQEKNTKQIIKTAAISLIVIGLILQISSFRG